MLLFFMHQRALRPAGEDRMKGREVALPARLSLVQRAGNGCGGEQACGQGPARLLGAPGTHSFRAQPGSPSPLSAIPFIELLNIDFPF